MKREHDTEPGAPDLTVEDPPPASTRKITMPGIGDATTARPPGQPTRRSRLPLRMATPPIRIYENDSVDEGINAIGNRRHPFPTSLQGGWREEAGPRPAPTSNDTLPTHGNVVVDTSTEPAERDRQAGAVPSEPVAVPMRPARTLLFVVAALVVVVLGIVTALAQRSGPASAAATVQPPTSNVSAAPGASVAPPITSSDPVTASAPPPEPPAASAQPPALNPARPTKPLATASGAREPTHPTAPRKDMEQGDPF